MDPRPKKEYLVTGIVQVVVEEADEANARIAFKDAAHDLIACHSSACHDPLNGAVVTGVADLTVEEWLG